MADSCNFAAPPDYRTSVPVVHGRSLCPGKGPSGAPWRGQARPARISWPRGLRGPGRPAGPWSQRCAAVGGRRAAPYPRAARPPAWRAAAFSSKVSGGEAASFFTPRAAQRPTAGNLYSPACCRITCAGRAGRLGRLCLEYRYLAALGLVQCLVSAFEGGPYRAGAGGVMIESYGHERSDRSYRAGTTVFDLLARSCDVPRTGARQSAGHR
jgi:hypothetical protein